MQTVERTGNWGAAREWGEAVARAVAVGVAASIALVIAVLVLAGTAQAQPGAGMQPGEATQGTLLLRGVNDPAAAPAPLLHTGVAIKVSGFVSRVRVTQRFANPHADWMEGLYVFPLPENAAVDGLAMRIGARVVEGEIKEREAAKRHYEAAKAGGQRAALLESERPNLFTTSVANIGPNEAVSITIEYQAAVRYERGRYSLRFPMVVGPRYAAGAADRMRIAQPVLARGDGDSAAGKTNPNAPNAANAANTASAANASIIHNPVNLHVELDPGLPLAALYAPYHKIVVEPGAGDIQRIALAAGVVPANRDFELVWAPAAGRAPQSALFREDRAGSTYALVMLMPPERGPAAVRIAREAIFVLDTSGSMQGASIEQARAALDLALGRLAPEDRFNVIEFNSVAKALHSGAVPASAANVATARRWVAGLAARGGTEIAKALDLALDGRVATDVVRQIVFLTDGAVGNEDALFRMIRERLGSSRLFTVGIGSAPNSHFMSKAAAEGRGTFTYIGRIEEVQAKMSELFAKLESPVLRDVRIDWSGATAVEMWPARIPDLYADEPVFVTARLAGPADAIGVRVSGAFGDKPWDASLKVLHPASAAGLSKLWARYQLDALAEHERAGVANAREQMIALALEHHLVSRYTSLVAVDKTPARARDAQLKTAAVPANLPDGWTSEGVFGEMPQTATGAAGHLANGLAALLAAFALYRLARRRAAPMGGRR